MEIPYTVETRPDTGLHNCKLGIWLFLASEVMLFGALFSTYIILRTGSVEWPHGELNIWLGMANTFILIASSVTMVMAWASLKLNDFPKHRLYLIGTFVLAGIFLVNKYFEYADHSSVVDSHGFLSTVLPIQMLEKKLMMNGIWQRPSVQAAMPITTFQCSRPALCAYCAPPSYMRRFMPPRP